MIVDIQLLLLDISNCYTHNNSINILTAMSLHHQNNFSSNIYFLKETSYVNSANSNDCQKYSKAANKKREHSYLVPPTRVLVTWTSPVSGSTRVTSISCGCSKGRPSFVRIPCMYIQQLYYHQFILCVCI